MSNARVEANKAAARRLFEAFATGDLTVFDELLVEDYIQHDPDAQDGREAVKTLFAAMGAQDVEVHRVIGEGDFVVVHAHYRTLGLAGIDILRFNEDGKIVEHWDVVRNVPEQTASGNDMFSQLS